MIVSFIPWADLGVTIFDAGATAQEVTTTVTGEELVSAYDEANGTTTTLAAPVEATLRCRGGGHPGLVEAS
ncbi:MAG: hypothetical protein ACLTDR_11910 [Adlercreutzia equolifaciens]